MFNVYIKIKFVFCMNLKIKSVDELAEVTSFNTIILKIL